jgi:hypothetical protein
VRLFEDIKPQDLLADNRVVNLFTRQDETSISGTHFGILIDNGYLIFCRAYLPKAKSINPSGKEWMGGILLEVPIAGFKWFMNTLQDSFFKTEAEGRLARGIFTAETSVEDENLSISRMFGIPGYSFTNHSRTAHWAARYDLSRPQELELPDDLLFELKGTSGNPKQSVKIALQTRKQ